MSCHPFTQWTQEIVGARLNRMVGHPSVTSRTERKPRSCIQQIRSPSELVMRRILGHTTAPTTAPFAAEYKFALPYPLQHGVLRVLLLSALTDFGYWLSECHVNGQIPKSATISRFKLAILSSLRCTGSNNRTTHQRSPFHCLGSMVACKAFFVQIDSGPSISSTMPTLRGLPLPPLAGLPALSLLQKPTTP